MWYIAMSFLSKQLIILNWMIAIIFHCGCVSSRHAIYLDLIGLRIHLMVKLLLTIEARNLTSRRNSSAWFRGSEVRFRPMGLWENISKRIRALPRMAANVPLVLSGYYTAAHLLAVHKTLVLRWENAPLKARVQTISTSSLPTTCFGHMLSRHGKNWVVPIAAKWY